MANPNKRVPENMPGDFFVWYSWPLQAESMERLAEYAFEWVLPGHGQKAHLSAAEMRSQILRLAESMKEKSRAHQRT